MIINRKMIFNNILGLLIVVIVCSCTQQSIKNKVQKENGPDQNIKAKTGLNIEYGPNLGTSHTDTAGINHFYVHSTAIIKNDSTIPTLLQFALASEYEFPAFCDDDNFKVFLLPEELTPDTATIYNGIVNGQHDYLNTPLDNPSVIDKLLNPGDYCVVTIGVLIQKPASCAAVPRAIFSHDNKGPYQDCDRLPNQAISTVPQLEIGVKLEYYYKRKFMPPEDGCAVIPFGLISYPVH